MNPTVFSLDFETYSATDIKKHGLHRYINDPHFEVLIAAITSEDGTRVLDFINMPHAFSRLKELLEDAILIYAHNAEFEFQVLQRIGIHLNPAGFIDTAVMSRCAGGSSDLASAAKQFLAGRKLDVGMRLINRFCKPGKYQEQLGTPEFSSLIITEDPSEWELFKSYCVQDTLVTWELKNTLPDFAGESRLSHPTHTMNRAGWNVDLDLVTEMQARYHKNLEDLEALFRNAVGDDPADPLKLNSFPQLKKWCHDRGVKAQSFDRESVAALIPRIMKKMGSLPSGDPKRHPLSEVLLLLQTKQALGGSSLKKLQTILDIVGDDGRLRHQYIHVGAAQTWRTTGVGVQMQNLKRIGGAPEDVEDLSTSQEDWDNDKLARSLRQCFTATHPLGRLIVGDFSSIESRALAYLAGESWKLSAYKGGQDLYKVQATKIYGVPYDAVTKEQRQTGKLGELSCGYGAGPKAVTKFAKNLGIDMDEQAAGELVRAWRDANPRIVALWDVLEDTVRNALAHGSYVASMGPLYLTVSHCGTPQWIQDKTNGNAQSLKLTLQGHGITVTRFFHGVHIRGGQLTYYKSMSNKTGEPWACYFRDPDTHQPVFYTVYGGKLAGILTQSLCREIFMDSLRNLDSVLQGIGNATIIGQFHDEIVVDWSPNCNPGDRSLGETEYQMKTAMTLTTLPGFPLDAEIKDDYRYTK